LRDERSRRGLEAHELFESSAITGEVLLAAVAQAQAASDEAFAAVPHLPEADGFDPSAAPLWAALAARNAAEGRFGAAANQALRAVVCVGANGWRAAYEADRAVFSALLR
jgi:hypothetical protein